ncbi:efflux RND transporter periplasmic adaptor subunit [Kaistia terrae]|uniref:Efflux RND transporter periplasmic adaptor subunit n=1 Tax=Kaistia terrae TaxID=537017 RepID=A0ABW0PWA1_9HYPH|nr:efflux RND transporter periplasmic adaptor subunit [Kaistia terrae]MCX5579478.1 efflux RND transporter periplasmic adaptor subunit [Kaistia terrae]
MRRSVVAVLVVAAVVVVGVAYREGLLPASIARFTASDGPPADKGGGGAKGGRRTATPSVTVAAAETGDLPVRRSTIGWINSTASTSVTTQQQGVVTRIALANGADVKAGDLLVQLDDRAAQATLARDKAALVRDQATVVSTKADLTRAQSLVAKQVDSSQQLDQAVAAAASAAAIISLDQANIDADQVVVDDMRIVAPHDGRLGAFAITVGSLVQPGTTVVVLTDMTNLEANFTVSDADVGLLRQSLASGDVPVRVSPSNQPTAEASGLKAAGNSVPANSATTSTQATVDFIDSNINTGSGTMAVRAAVPNPDRTFWPGQAVKVEIDLGRHSNVVLVPTVAVQPGQTGSNVFVVKPDQTIDVRPVELAGIVGDRAGIVSGLKAGEMVVTEGQLSLASGMKVTVRDAKPAPTEKGAPSNTNGDGAAITKGDTPQKKSGAPASVDGSEAKL